MWVYSEDIDFAYKQMQLIELTFLKCTILCFLV